MKKRSPETMKKIRDFAEQYYTDYGRSPSTTMIANEVGVSRGTAYKYLVEMNEKGIISYDGKQIATTLTQNSNADRSMTEELPDDLPAAKDRLQQALSDFMDEEMSSNEYDTGRGDTGEGNHRNCD